jgi:hypothetical protein
LEATGLTFEECGIASALTQHFLTVPLNQRPYKWGETPVQALLDDLTRSFIANEDIYFLGMIVLTHGPTGQLEVADGQQRLATTSIIVAAIRDFLLELNDIETAQLYQSKYLLEYDPPSKEYKPKLQLNFEDRDFFIETILKSPDKRTEYEGNKLSSHERLENAAKRVKQHIRNMTAAFNQSSEKEKRIYEWMDFLHKSAKVIVITVPGYVGNAFKMFETLNARGMKASQIDILKNYLFNKAKNKIADMQPRWASMMNTIDSLMDSDDEDDILIDYIRYYWIAHHGPTTERELGDSIQKTIISERLALDLVMALDSFSSDYASLLMPREHPKLGNYGSSTRDCIYTITKELSAKQILPLLMAILRYLDVPEAKKAFNLCLSWTVRFLIAGGGGGGVLDRQYALRAKEISNREITTARDLATRMSQVVHTDQAFEEAFKTASIFKTKLARYYIRAIELYLANDPYPQFVPNEDVKAVNAEHILPQTPSDGWNILADVAASYNKRLGNLVLMKAMDNVKIGNKGFGEKKDFYRRSPFLTTQWVAEYSQWGPDEINNRQSKLAELAPKVWPINI